MEESDDVVTNPSFNIKSFMGRMFFGAAIWIETTVESKVRTIGPSSHGFAPSKSAINVDDTFNENDADTEHNIVTTGTLATSNRGFRTLFVTEQWQWRRRYYDQQWFALALWWSSTTRIVWQWSNINPTSVPYTIHNDGQLIHVGCGCHHRSDKNVACIHITRQSWKLASSLPQWKQYQWTNFKIEYKTACSSPVLVVDPFWLPSCHRRNLC